jgi:hypothetical protein
MLPSASGISSTPAAEHVDQPAPEKPGFERYGSHRGAVGIGDGGVADRGNDDAVAVRDQHLASGGARPRRVLALELALQAAVSAGPLLPGAALPAEPLRQKISGGIDLIDELADSLAAMVEHLHDGADANRDQKGDDQGRHSTPQCRLRGQQPQVSRLGDGLSQSRD